MIRIVGLGPGDSKYITKEVLDVLQSTDTVYMRTTEHPTHEFLRKLQKNIVSFDAVYREKESFDDVYQAISDMLIDKAKTEDIVYAVPGNPLVAEKTVDIIQTTLDESNYEIYYGVSFLDLIINRLKIDPVKGFSVIDAANLDEQCLFHKGYVVIMQCYDRILASELKLWLSKIVDEESDVTVVNAVGTEATEKISTMKLYELDHKGTFDDMTSIVVDLSAKKNDFSELLLHSNRNSSKIDQVAEILSMRKAVEKIISSADNEDFDLILEDELSIILKNIVNISSFNSDKYFDFFNLI